MSFLFNQRGVSHLSIAVNSSETELRIPWADFNSFMRSNARNGDRMMAILRGPIEREIVAIDLINSFSGTTDKYLKVIRGQGGTASTDWPAGTLLFISTHADHYNACFQPDSTRQVDFNPNGTLVPNYAGEKVFQYAGCEIRWFMSFNAVDPFWSLIAGEPCPNEVWAQPPGFDWPVWSIPGQLTYISKQDQGNIYHGVWVQGGYIIAACHDGGLRTYSVDGNGDLTFVAFDYQGTGFYTDVWGDGTFLYATCAAAGLRSFTMDGAGVLTFKDTIYTGASYQSVWGDGNFIYAATRNGGIKSHSVDGGGNLTQLDNYTVGAGSNDYDGVFADGNFVYAACDLDGLRSFTVDGGGLFTLKDHISSGLYRVRKIWGDGTFLYSVGSNANLGRYGGLASYVVSGGGLLALLSRWHDFGATSNWTGVWGNGSVILTTVHNDGLYSFSVDAFGVATLLDTDAQGFTPEYNHVHGDGNFLYVAADDDGLRSYQVS